MLFATRPLFAFLLVGSAFYLYSTMSAATRPVPPTLEVRVKSPFIPPSFSPPIAVTVQVSVHNNAKSSVTLLNWGSPLDPKANVLGVFEFRDIHTEETVTLNTIKFARKLPPSKEDFVEIPAGDIVDAEVTIPLVPLVEGHRYTIQAKGWWQAVWEWPLHDIADHDLETMAGPSVQRGEFESEIVPIEVE
ncbi:hypothetical protein BJX99DRAFT_123067 [Aspergillus californicus]